jgi:hypothetical protein
MILQMVKNEYLRFGVHVDIQVIYKILKLEITKEVLILHQPHGFQGGCFKAILTKITLCSLGINLLLYNFFYWFRCNRGAICIWTRLKMCCFACWLWISNLDANNMLSLYNGLPKRYIHPLYPTKEMCVCALIIVVLCDAQSALHSHAIPIIHLKFHFKKKFY